MSIICAWYKNKISKHDVYITWLHEKKLWILKGACNKNNKLLKKEYDIANKGLELNASEKNCHICKKKLEANMLIIKNIKLEIIVIVQVKYKGAAHSICNLRYKIPKGIPIVFHNWSNYYYHFIIRTSRRVKRTI